MVQYVLKTRDFRLIYSSKKLKKGFKTSEVNYTKLYKV